MDECWDLETDARKKNKTDFLKKKEEFQNERMTTNVKTKIDLKRKTKGKDGDGDEAKKQIVLLLLFRNDLIK